MNITSEVLDKVRNEVNIGQVEQQQHSSSATMSSSTSLNQVLAFQDGPGASLPPGLSLLITDTLASPGTFLLTHFLARGLKEGRNCVLLSFRDVVAHYEGILKKNSVQLSTFTRTGQFRFIDGLNALTQGSPKWEDIFRQIKDALGSFDNSTQPPLVNIDDITALLWAGHCSVRDVIQLASALRVLSRDLHFSLVTLFHGDNTFTQALEDSPPDPEDNSALQHILLSNDIWISTRSLRSQQIGEFTVNRAPGLLSRPHIPVTTYTHTIQYKLEETGPKIWTKGTASGYL